MREYMDSRNMELISVCICTFKRPELLSRLLTCLSAQKRTSWFAFDTVVVDNDKKRSAEETVRKFQNEDGMGIRYVCEPEQNIALARNCAIRNANGNLIAFIDDDEHPAKDWLLHLYQAMNQYKADGVLGPVLPEFQPGAPRWLKEGDFFNRRRLVTGSTIGIRDARTGNVLFRRTLFRDGELWFDPLYGRTGGEDGDFFQRQGRLGRVFIWCDEAVVYETVPLDRCKLSFHLKKSLTGQSACLDGYSCVWFLAKNLSALGLLGLLTPFMYVVKARVRAKGLMKIAYCAGYCSGFCGFNYLQERE
jgi:glycosyltransferase involved in cell wall biosynthesis